ncbi:MAG: metallophosphatase family protein [Myxococcales bacterium]|nr:metallophosphatase family protein [Myxococcales bacterium]
MLALLAAAALAGPRLVLVGDTGEDTAIGRVVSAQLVGEMATADWLLALGDFYYDAPPIDDNACAQLVAERLRLFYGAIPPRKVIPVLGNHDVTTAAQDGFSPAARACSVAAFGLLGWTSGEYPSAVRSLDKAGVRVDLAVIDAGFYGAGAPKPSLSFRTRAWRLYASHYTWRTTAGKCEEQDKIPVGWLGSPPMDLWLNSHAHHLDAVMVDSVLALTSGGGMEMRKPKVCPDVTSQFTHAQGDGAPMGGYLVVDVLSGSKLKVTPTVCAETGCLPKPSIECTRLDKGPGVRCAATP